MSAEYRRPGYNTLTAGLSVENAPALLKFLTAAFDARERDITRDANGGIIHAEIMIGDSLVEMSEARPEWPAKPCSLHLYVPDPDATYERAVGAGARSLTKPEDAHYGDRAAAVEDLAGNHWFIARRLEGPPVPKGFRAVTPYLITRGADAVMRFVKETFDGTEQSRFTNDAGKIQHAEMAIGDSVLELSDGGGEWKPRPVCLHIYVPDADATHARALAAGATSVYQPTDQPYGDREGGVQDSGGNYWFIATHRPSNQRS